MCYSLSVLHVNSWLINVTWDYTNFIRRRQTEIYIQAQVNKNQGLISTVTITLIKAISLLVGVLILKL